MVKGGATGDAAPRKWWLFRYVAQYRAAHTGEAGQ
jgi:hypothetical protein